VWYGTITFQPGSSVLSAKVVVYLKDMTLFRENRSLCIGLFDTDEIVTAIKCICTVLSDNAVYSLPVFLSVYCLSLHLC